MPNLDDYIMNTCDPFVEDFVWPMDDSRHTESVSKELTEIDILRLLLFADRDVMQALRVFFLQRRLPGQLITVPRRSEGTDKACARMS